MKVKFSTEEMRHSSPNSKRSCWRCRRSLQKAISGVPGYHRGLVTKEFSFPSLSFKYFAEFHLEFASNPWQAMSRRVNPGDWGTSSFLSSRLLFWTQKLDLCEQQDLVRFLKMFRLFSKRLLQLFCAVNLDGLFGLYSFSGQDCVGLHIFWSILSRMMPCMCPHVIYKRIQTVFKAS